MKAVRRNSRWSSEVIYAVATVGGTLKEFPVEPQRNFHQNFWNNSLGIPGKISKLILETFWKKNHGGIPVATLKKFPEEFSKKIPEEFLKEIAGEVLWK